MVNDIIIEEKQSKVIKTNLAGIFMSILSAGIFIFGLYNHSVLYRLIGCLGLIYFVIMTIIRFSRVLKPKALLTITHEGIDDTSSASSFGFISFHEIKSFYIVNIFGQQMIGVDLKNVTHFINHIPTMKQKVVKANLKMKLPPVTLRVDTAKDISIEDILSLLQKRLSDFSRLYD